MKINDVQFNVELEDILMELKNELNANGIELLSKMKDGPTHIQICCPYHANGHERRPSAGIRKEDGIFHCFACGEVHSLQEVISHCFGYTDDIVGSFGWQWLLKNFTTVQVEERKDVELDFSRNLGHINLFSNRNKGTERYVTEEELDKYRYTHPYMYKRGLTDEVIEIFDIGYDKDTDCITFPIRNTAGRCLFVARRSVNTKFFNYPNLSEKSVYGLYELYQLHSFPDEVWITESMIDALRLWGVGLYACALNGLGSNNQYKQLSSMPCRVFVLATDMDKAGLDARKSIKRSVNGKLFKQIFLPPGRKDIGDCSDAELKNLKVIF